MSAAVKNKQNMKIYDEWKREREKMTTIRIHKLGTIRTRSVYDEYN